jgi:hypothetical protein
LMLVCCGLVSGCVTQCSHLKNQPITFTCQTCSGCNVCARNHEYWRLCITCCSEKGVAFKVQ